MGWWRKLNTAPLSAVPCRSCGRRLRGSWVMPFVVGAGLYMTSLAAGRMSTLGLALAVIAFGALILVAVGYLTPLVGRDDT